MDKVKATVEFIHRSTVAAERLKSTQHQMELPELRPKQECATRWNPIFYMFKHILETNYVFISTLALINEPVDMLNQEEWELRSAPSCNHMR